MKSGGYKISALDVERHLLVHDDIKECTVVGVPDLTWGQRVAAIVVLKGDATMTLSELRAWARDHMAPYIIPTELRIVSDIPRNAMGKINKKQLLKDIFELEWTLLINTGKSHFSILIKQCQVVNYIFLNLINNCSEVLSNAIIKLLLKFVLVVQGNLEVTIQLSFAGLQQTRSVYMLACVSLHSACTENMNETWMQAGYTAHYHHRVSPPYLHKDSLRKLLFQRRAPVKPQWNVNLQHNEHIHDTRSNSQWKKN